LQERLLNASQIFGKRKKLKYFIGRCIEHKKGRVKMDILIIIAILLVVIVYLLFTRMPSITTQRMEEKAMEKLIKEQRRVEDEHLRENPYRTVEAAKEAIISERKEEGWETTEEDLEFILDNYRRKGWLVEEEKK
jgi:hypothetical protein